MGQGPKRKAKTIFCNMVLQLVVTGAWQGIDLFRMLRYCQPHCYRKIMNE